MANLLVAGVNGFVGHHVAKALYSRGSTVIGVGNHPELDADLSDTVAQYIECDLTSADDVAKIDLSNIDAIINLAGLAKVGESFGQGELYNHVNVGVHTTLYEECLRQGVSPRIVAVSTGAVYSPNQPMPLTEESELIDDKKTNEYVVSKKLTEDAVHAFNARGLHCVIVRPFNHTGPGQLPGFLLPDLYEQVQQSKSTKKPLKVGNLDTKRDFTDVRDVADAYAELALCKKESLSHTIYNVCSGRSIAGKEILRILAEACGMATVSTEVDPAKLRKNEVMDIVGSSAKLQKDTGWEPRISIEQTIHDFVRNMSS